MPYNPMKIVLILKRINLESKRKPQQSLFYRIMLQIRSNVKCIKNERVPVSKSVRKKMTSNNINFRKSVQNTTLKTTKQNGKFKV